MKKLLFGIVLMATSVLASTSFESLLKSDERRPPPEGSGKNPFGEDEDLVEPIDFNINISGVTELEVIFENLGTWGVEKRCFAGVSDLIVQKIP